MKVATIAVVGEAPRGLLIQSCYDSRSCVAAICRFARTRNRHAQRGWEGRLRTPKRKIAPKTARWKPPSEKDGTSEFPPPTYQSSFATTKGF